MNGGFVVALVVGPVVMAVIAGVSHAVVRGRIERNHTVGMRLPSLLRSDAAWEAGHRAALRPAIASAVILSLVSIGAVLLHARGVAEEPLTLGAVVLLLLAVALISVVANRAARTAEPPR